MFLKLFIILFVFFAVTRVFSRYKRQEISSREVIVWTVFWILVLAATLWPNTTDIVARYFGVGRGADFLIFLSIVALFFMVFRIIVKIEKIEKNITAVVRKSAIDEANSNKHAE